MIGSSVWLTTQRGAAHHRGAGKAQPAHAARHARRHAAGAELPDLERRRDRLAIGERSCEPPQCASAANWRSCTCPPVSQPPRLLLRYRTPRPTLAACDPHALGPIFRVELVTAARQRRYYLLRVIYAAIILFVLWVAYVEQSVRSAVSGGDAGSRSASWPDTATTFFYAFSLGATPRHPRRRPGDGRRHDRHGARAPDDRVPVRHRSCRTSRSSLGKTFARLLMVGKFVLVSLPILFLFRLLGGIPADCSRRRFSSPAARPCSSRRSASASRCGRSARRDAAMRVYLVLAALLFLPPLSCGTALALRARTSGWWQSLLEPALDFLVGLNPMLVLGRRCQRRRRLGRGVRLRPCAEDGWLARGIVRGPGALWRRWPCGASICARRAAGQRAEEARASSLAVAAPLAARAGRRPMLWKESFAATPGQARPRRHCGGRRPRRPRPLASIIYVFCSRAAVRHRPTTAATTVLRILRRFNGFVGGACCCWSPAGARG